VALAGLTSVIGFSARAAADFHGHGARTVCCHIFCEVHPRSQPYITTIWTGVAVGAVAMLTDIVAADLTNIGTLLPSFCLSGCDYLRRKEAGRHRPFRVPMVPLSPSSVSFCFVLMLSLPLETWGRFVVWLVIGLCIYFLYGLRHSKLRRGLDAGINRRRNRRR